MGKYYFYESEETFLYKETETFIIGVQEKKERYYVILDFITKSAAFCKLGLISTIDHGAMKRKHKISVHYKYKYVHFKKVPDKIDFITIHQVYKYPEQFIQDNNCLAVIEIWPGFDVYYSLSPCLKSKRLRQEFSQILQQGRITKSLIDELKIK